MSDSREGSLPPPGVTSSRPPPFEVQESANVADEKRFQVLAAHVVSGLFALMKVALVHKMDNEAVLPVVDRFGSALAQFQGEYGDEVAVQFVGEAVYINRRLVRADVGTWEKARFLRDFFARIQIAELTFDEPMGAEALRQLAQGLRDTIMENLARDALRARSIRGVRMRGISAEAGAGESITEVPDRLRVLRAYGLIVATLREVLERLQDGKSAPLVPVRRGFQELARLPDRTRPLQLGLLSLEHHRTDPAGRLARIGVIAVLMARRLSLRVGDLRDIGVAASLAWLGSGLSADAIALPPEDAAARGHFVESVRRLLPYSGRGRGTVLRLVAAVQQGDAEGRRAGHPISRITAVAEAYDRLTMPRPYGPALSPDVALSRIVEDPGLDRAAARLLVATLGLFPVGSTVKLSSGETAVVLDVTEDPQRLVEPRVMVIAGPDGAPCPRRALDLAGSGVTIVGSVSARDMELNIGHFLFS